MKTKKVSKIKLLREQLQEMQALLALKEFRIQELTQKLLESDLKSMQSPAPQLTHGGNFRVTCQCTVARGHFGTSCISCGGIIIL